MNTATSDKDGFRNLERAVQEQQRQIVQHPVYARLKSVSDLRTFMEHHVFAVWDFMTLLKRLQRDLTSVEIAWRPSTLPHSRRLINEIVLAEESDEISQGRYLSHLELYIDAMKEVEANHRPIETFITELRHGTTVLDALSASASPHAARAFSRHTWNIASKASTHEVASAFLFGREDLIPDMFRSVLQELGHNATTLRLYLDRHIELDEGSHGPLARELLQELCNTNPSLWQEASEAATASLTARVSLWDEAVKTMGLQVPVNA